jgi:hypothetical protein
MKRLPAKSTLGRKAIHLPLSEGDLLGTTIPLHTLEARIKRRFRAHLSRLGFHRNGKGELSPPEESKEFLRRMHSLQRQDLLSRELDFVSREWPRLRKYFSDGSEINPRSITPRLEQVAAESWQTNLFRLATLSWSVPVSQGYGRRLRFLVWDESNGKLMGLIALCDPVFNLRVRDDFVGWNAEDRKRRLVHTFSAYVLGAAPPYNGLLGGKLVACLIRTREVRDAFAQKYKESTGIISKEAKNPSLVLVITSSALGRSSVYNRLNLDGCRYFSSLGYTKGWGHFHIPQDLFNLIRQYLAETGHAYARNNRFGDGPNWRFRSAREAMSLLGINPNSLRHGLEREVFACELAVNARRFLRGEVQRPYYRGLLSVSEVASMARERWVVPRAMRYPEFRAWKHDSFLQLITPSCIEGIGGSNPCRLQVLT